MLYTFISVNLILAGCGELSIDTADHLAPGSAGSSHS